MNRRWMSFEETFRAKYKSLLNTIGEGLDESEKKSIRGWRKVTETKIFITLSPVVLWKIENTPNALIDLAKYISMQNVDCANYFLIMCGKDR